MARHTYCAETGVQAVPLLFRMSNRSMYGSPYILRFDILNSKGTACTPVSAPPVITGCALDATGSVTITDNGSPLDQGTFPVNAEGSGEDQPIQLPPGTHNLSASYSGDNSYNASGPVADSVTVTKATTSTAVTATTSTITTSTSVTLTATITTQSNEIGRASCRERV